MRLCALTVVLTIDMPWLQQADSATGAQKSWSSSPDWRRAEGAPPCELGIELEFEPEETSHGEQPDIF